MGVPRCNYHMQKTRWQEYDEDEKEFNDNRPKYKGISGRPENLTWYYRRQNKQIKTCRRLSEIYEFKLKYEAENER